jgi:CHAD domain-containing protein
VINRLTLGGKDATGARDLDARSDDDTWHLVRRRVKRARYAAEAVAPVAGLRADHLAHALADVQDVLGAHRDAVFAAATWLAISSADPDDHALAVTAGRLAERERARARQTRHAYPEVWRAADRGRLTGWLR